MCNSGLRCVSVPAVALALCLLMCGASADECDGKELVPTVTFDAAKCGDWLSFSNADCWSPHLPTVEDVVMFPKGTHVGVAFSWIYTPLRAKSVVVAAGATLVMRGSAIQVSECFQIFGTVSLEATDKTDNTAASSVTFLADRSAPLGLDCSVVSRGYTPRICGPGVVAVHGKLVVSGYRASLFARTRVLGDHSKVEFHRMAFLWGSLENYGVIDSDGMYLQGHISNEADGRLHLTTLRIERFGVMDKFHPITIFNRGVMSMSSPDTSQFWNYLNQKTKKTITNERSRLKFVNEGKLTMSNLHYAHVFAGINLDMFNAGGNITWAENHEFYLQGSMVNTNGQLIADQANVFLNDYASQDGVLLSKNGGWFHFGSAAGVDTKTTVLCEKKQKKLVKRSVPIQLPVKTFAPKLTNVSCTPGQWGGCPSGLCCGAHGFCEEPRCMNADGYGGGPFCCPENTVCGGSSHGPYCGQGIFSWEVDPECMAELEYVDRYEFEVMQTRFPALELPKFGKHRYTMRGASTVESDGTGGVAFTESIEVRDTLAVRRGATLSNLMDNGAVPFSGKGQVSVEGRFIGGIKSTFDGNQNIVIAPEGRMEVPAYGTVWLHDSAHLDVRPGATLQVDGKIFVMKKPTATTKHTAVKQCGTLTGAGGIVGDVALKCN